MAVVTEARFPWVEINFRLTPVNVGKMCAKIRKDRELSVLEVTNMLGVKKLFVEQAEAGHRVHAYSLLQKYKEYYGLRLSVTVKS